MHIVTDEKGYPFSGLLLCIIQLFYFTFFRFSTLHLWDCRSPASSTDEGLTFFRAYRAEEKINYDLFNLLRVEPLRPLHARHSRTFRVRPACAKLKLQVLTDDKPTDYVTSLVLYTTPEKYQEFMADYESRTKLLKEVKKTWYLKLRIYTEVRVESLILFRQECGQVVLGAHRVIPSAVATAWISASSGIVVSHAVRSRRRLSAIGTLSVRGRSTGRRRPSTWPKSRST
jgi:hypothetical protein